LDRRLRLERRLVGGLELLDIWLSTDLDCHGLLLDGKM
jgi:hypothetical protein